MSTLIASIEAPPVCTCEVVDGRELYLCLFSPISCKMKDCGVPRLEVYTCGKRVYRQALPFIACPKGSESEVSGKQLMALSGVGI